MSDRNFIKDKEFLHRRTKAMFAIQVLCGIEEFDAFLIELFEDMSKIMMADETVPARAVGALHNISFYSRMAVEPVMKWREERGLLNEIEDDEDGLVFPYPVPDAAPDKPGRQSADVIHHPARARLVIERAIDKALRTPNLVNNEDSGDNPPA